MTLMEDSNSHPPRCPCGFWGSSETQGMCSKCYKENESKPLSSESCERMSKVLACPLPTPNTASLCEESHAEKVIAKCPTDQPRPDDRVTEVATRVTEVTTRVTPPDAANSCDSSPPESSASSTSSSNLKRDISEVQDEGDRMEQRNKKRCFQCNCRLELALRQIGRCKCDYVFCAAHRLPEQHTCVYDHKEAGRQEARDKMVSPKKHMGTSLKRIDSDT